jgi:hypothetical protein
MRSKDTKKTYEYRIKLPIEFVNQVDDIIKKHPDLTRAKFYLFIDLINRKTISQPKKELRGQWARLKAEYIKDFIGYQYKKYIDILTDNNIVNRNYYSEGKSYDYSVNYVFESEELTEIKLNRKLQSKVLKDYVRPTTKAARLQYDTLKSNSFKFDAAGAFNWVQNQSELNKNKLIAYNSSITHLYEKNIFVFPSKSGRHYHNFNLIKSDLRQYCTLDNETLIGIDLKSSQPYFLACKMLKEYPDNPDIQKFYNIVTKQDIYTWMLEQFDQEHPDKFYLDYKYDEIYKTWIGQNKYLLTRNDIKPEFLKVLFKDNKGSTPLQTIFKNKLPSVYDYIRTKKSIKKNNLAIELQKAEADIFIKAADKMFNQGIKVLTVHDSIYCKESDKINVLIILKNEFNIQGYKDYILEY